MGSPMTFEGKDHITTLEGQKSDISRGPVAAFVAIKHLGTNGGGFFGTNSAHPLKILITLPILRKWLLR